MVNPEDAKNGDTNNLYGKYNEIPIIDMALYDFVQYLKITPYKKIGNRPKIQSYHHGTLYWNNRNDIAKSKITNPPNLILP